MQQLTAPFAGRYAAAVHQALIAEFPGLKKRTLELILLENVARQAEAPMASFQFIVDEVSSANWRLTPEHPGGAPWRVQIGCWKLHPAPADSERENRLNAALRAIEI